VKALVTGATGLIGGTLLSRLQAPRVLVRDVGKASRALQGAELVAWDSSQAVPEGAMDGIDVVFHLAGSPVAAGRMTDARKKEIRDSRVLGTRRIVDARLASRAKSDRPKVLVNASAVGFYGSRGDETLTEESLQGDGFLADVCAAWEDEAMAAKKAGVRVVCARIGIVLAHDGGALKAMLPAFRLGVGGPLGDGKQWMPWIHLDDVVGLLLHGATNDAVEGPLDLTGPAPVTNATFTRALGHALHRPAFLRAPVAALRLVMGDLTDVVIASQRVLPKKALATGYAFAFSDLDAALRSVLAAPKKPGAVASVAP
jgi:uncharacterized protein (TIGR01777 family)